MSCVVDFFRGIKTDMEMIAENGDIDSDVRDIRVSSVALKVLGSIVAISTVGSLVTGVSLVAGSSLAAIALLASTVFGAIIAHDLIQMGCNQSDRIKLFTSPSKNADVPQIISHYARGFFRLGKEFIGEVTGEAPFILHNTWIAENVYKLFQDTSISRDQEI